MTRKPLRTTEKPAALRAAIVGLLGFKNADDVQKGACRVCAQPVKSPRKYYCGAEHAREFSNGMFMTVREFTVARAQGVCECGCGLDTARLVRERVQAGATPRFQSKDLRWMLEDVERFHKLLTKAQARAAERAALESILEEWNAPKDRTDLLECDHKIPFERWTGDPIECNGPDNLWALAIPCHRRKTAAEAGTRAKAKRTAKRAAKMKMVLDWKAGRVPEGS